MLTIKIALGITLFFGSVSCGGVIAMSCYITSLREGKKHDCAGYYLGGVLSTLPLILYFIKLLN